MFLALLFGLVITGCDNTLGGNDSSNVGIITFNGDLPNSAFIMIAICDNNSTIIDSTPILAWSGNPIVSIQSMQLFVSENSTIQDRKNTNTKWSSTGTYTVVIELLDSNFSLIGRYRKYDVSFINGNANINFIDFTESL